MDPAGDIIKRGYLKVTASKGLGNSLTRLAQKKHWIILRMESRASKARIEIFKGEDDSLRKSPTRILCIAEVTSVQSSGDRKELFIMMPGEMVTFTCSSRADQEDWVRDIETLRRGGGGGGGPNNSVSQPQPPSEEDIFRVRLRQSPSLLFHGPCILEIQQDLERNLFHIALLCDESPPRLVVKWQIDHIRQYGSNEVAFKFQSGSKSPTNVDWFILDTEPGDAPKIHRLVDYWAHHIVEQARNTSMSLPPPPLRRDTMPTSSIGFPSHISPSSPPPLSSRLSSSVPLSPPFPPSNGVYQELTSNTREPVPIYDGIDNRQLPSTPPPSLPPPPSSNNSSSVYQSLNSTSFNGAGDYAGLNEITRVPTNSAHHHSAMTPPTNTAQEGVYQGLNNATRLNQEATYMDINVSKT